MDNLEEHIMNNRQELDRYSPTSEIWKRIKKELNTGKLSIRKWLSIAAMFIVIPVTVLVLIKKGYFQPDDGRERNSDATEAKENPQMKETEIYYNNLINSLYREATPLLTGNPEIEQELVTDISQLDSICLEIKKDLKDNVANQEVAEALIQNYRIKIRLLEEMLVLLKVNEDNPEKPKSYEL